VYAAIACTDLALRSGRSLLGRVHLDRFGIVADHDGYGDGRRFSGQIDAGGTGLKFVEASPERDDLHGDSDSIDYTRVGPSAGLAAIFDHAEAKEAKQMTGSFHGSANRLHLCIAEVVSVSCARLRPCFQKGAFRVLEPDEGNLHVRFLEGWRPATASGHSATPLPLFPFILIRLGVAAAR